LIAPADLLAGWYKAVVLVDFVLCSATAARTLIVHFFLGGLLPGEDQLLLNAVFATFFRVVPYCLNNWERGWGAECTSLLYDLPHFAVEFWVVLPLTQVRSLYPFSFLPTCTFSAGFK
jgi:hypothetical protein